MLVNFYLRHRDETPFLFNGFDRAVLSGSPPYQLTLSDLYGSFVANSEPLPEVLDIVQIFVRFLYFVG
jgi:hypothetical protein